MPKPYDRTTYGGGKPVDWRTRAALELTASRLGYDLTILQGSFNPGGVGASAGTHDGGGVVDLAPADWKAKVRELRRTGFAAWHRPAIPGLWGEHIHAVLMGNRNLSPSAKRQVVAYQAGRDGLAGNGPDTGPRDYVRNRFSWRVGLKRITRARRSIERARAQLSTGVRGFPGIKRALAALGRAEAALPKAD